jgi:hypothetical protein
VLCSSYLIGPNDDEGKKIRCHMSSCVAVGIVALNVMSSALVGSPGNGSNVCVCVLACPLVMGHSCCVVCVMLLYATKWFDSVGHHQVYKVLGWGGILLLCYYVILLFMFVNASKCS